ncbi:MAG: aldo/keto reductase [Eubacterium sp.]|nr:aldo/keto reductase [Eubacterium sp.]
MIATKAGDTIGKGPLDRGLSRSSVMRELDRSLKRLNTDYVDIYYMHMPDWVTDIEEALETYTDIVRSGKARYIGMSNFPSWGVCEALWKAETLGLCKPVVTQMVYNQITRSIDVEFVPFCKAHDIGLVTYNPLAGGILTGKYKRDVKPTSGRFTVDRLGNMYTGRYWKDDCFDAVEKLAAIADDAGMTPAEFAARWVISNPAVTSVLVGFTKETQLLQNMESIEKGPLPADLLEKCDSIWQDYTGNQFLHIRY